MNMKTWRIVSVIALCTAWFFVSACNVSDNTNVSFNTNTRADTGTQGGADAANTAEDVSPEEDAAQEPDVAEEDATSAADVMNEDAGNDDAGNDDAGNDDAGNDDAGNDDAGNDDAGDTGGMVDDCTLAADDTPCGETIIAQEVECVYRGVCDRTGVRTVTRTLRVCEDGACVNRDDSVMEICGARDTEGQTCGDTQIGRTTICTRIDPTQCSTAGQSTTTNIYSRCDDQGACAEYPEQVSTLCDIDPDGLSCGAANDGTCYATCCEEPCLEQPCRLCPRLE